MTTTKLDPIPPQWFNPIMDGISATLRNSLLTWEIKQPLLVAVQALFFHQGKTPLALSDPNLLAVQALFLAAGFTQAQIDAALSSSVAP